MYARARVWTNGNVVAEIETVEKIVGETLHATSIYGAGMDEWKCSVSPISIIPNWPLRRSVK
jgi:hypothetical protein